MEQRPDYRLNLVEDVIAEGDPEDNQRQGGSDCTVSFR
jgi:hypothetical protein